MFEIFYQYLVIHKKVAVPGFGTFLLSRTSAQLNFSQKTFTAPTWEINFIKSDTVADKNFYAFAARQQGVDDVEVIRRVNDFTFDIKREFSVYKKLEWPKIGLIIENAQGEYQLQKENHIHPYFPDAAAQRISRENVDKSMFEGSITPAFTDTAITKEELKTTAAKKEDWWTDAIILAILAIAAIGYYYFQNGGFQ